jgi:hypothetical protein
MLANPSDHVASFKLIKPVLAVNSLVFGEGFFIFFFRLVQWL